MKREINIAENWERAYDAFQQVNFKAWDFNTIKQSLLDYMKVYYPEDFNDYIESSDFIAIIETFAYIAELLAYRIDLNTHENFLTTAERKESVLRLAKYLSYNPSRKLPARGLVKITSIKTTESVIDSRGNDLVNKTIKWNDFDNPNWKEQFILVLNKIIQQEVGTVLPSDRVQVQDVLFELYACNNKQLTNNVIPYSVAVSGLTYPMELVSSELNEFGPIEKRPEKNQSFNILYLRDGMGDSSDNTGFFFFTKQGEMKRSVAEFDGILPNQTVTIDFENINETDIWVNNIDPETDKVLLGNEVYGEPRKGEWEQVDVANTQNVLFNASPNRNKYEIETLSEDRVRIIFGDGNFANIPSGKFEFWTRINEMPDGNDLALIPKNAIQNNGADMDYVGDDGRTYKFSFTFSLFSPIQNSAPSESIERIKEIAPSVYYTQDRMVNGRDYNEFMLKDNTILKLRSINRTFAGDSKFIAWHDPKEYYDNVKLFGDDLIVYYKTDIHTQEILSEDLPALDGGLNVPIINTLIYNHLEPVLRTQETYNTAILFGVNSENFRQEFKNSELIDIREKLLSLILSPPNTVYFTYDVVDPQSDNMWRTQLTTEPSEWWIKLEAHENNNWTLTYRTKELLVESDEINFTVTNDGEKVITYDTLNTNEDEIVILKANVGSDGNTLGENKRFFIIRGENTDVGVDTGLCNYDSLVLLPRGSNNRIIPADVSLAYLIGDDDYVYFYRDTILDPWKYVPYTNEVLLQWENDTEDLWKRESGVTGLNFMWVHRTPRYHLIDPAASNIIDAFIITRGYYQNVRQWIEGNIKEEPKKPTAFQLRSEYSYLTDSKMISDTLILQPGNVKLLLGGKADESLQAFVKVVRGDSTSISDNRLKNEIVAIVDEFFDINRWNFGQPFYFTELAAKIHQRLNAELDSVVLVPKSPKHLFGSLYQVKAKESEILQGYITEDDIEIVESLTPKNLQQRL